MTQIISRAMAQGALEATFGAGVRVCLEPEDSMMAKLGTAKEPELWCWDPSSGDVGRGDGKFYVGRVVKHFGGWYLYAVYQEPKVPVPDEGPRVVGHVIVVTNAAGLLKVKKGKGIEGPILELGASSISKGDIDKSGEEPVVQYIADPQRIMGSIAVYHHVEEFPAEEGMVVRNYVLQTNDGRSLAAIAKLHVLGKL